ncbi:hypothetical protein [Nonlabens marinus]|uniref:Uncharacterized protein n=1 Tax=Nonlabens marinus S1-08 TaxID=1454201 RepID=W8VWC4_9FLAO|nr:hypothetical protein [Nonlabens marinus]BAO56183.1 hypothetical protein NMS_2174 [Nonlabens marinus S1-08]
MKYLIKWLLESWLMEYDNPRMTVKHPSLIFPQGKTIHGAAFSLDGKF